MTPSRTASKISIDKLLSGIVETNAYHGPGVSRLSSDSRDVHSGDAFVALRGYESDGREFLLEAERAGAAVALVEDALPASAVNLTEMQCVVVPSLRDKLGLIASRLHGEPSKRLHIAAVTGTNGKTTVSQLLAQLIRSSGYDCGVIGTLGVSVESQPTPTEHTTPDPIALQHTLAQWVASAVPFACIEASSHALSQGRLNGVEIDTTVFTNLTRDHLDYHGSMQAYGDAKARLFELPGVRTAILNADDPFCESLHRRLGDHLSVLRYSVKRRDVELYASKMRANLDGISLRIESDWGRADLRCPLLGQFNASNLLAAIAGALKAGIPFDAMVAGVGKLQPVQGRMQPLRMSGAPLIVVDYAHTPDALSQALQTLRPLCAGSLLLVFGCGGDRDRGKRALMAAVASEFADHSIVTSDNPRSEDPGAILAEISAAMTGEYTLVEDRGAAIAQAVASAQPGDCVLVAGKGHEDYQIVGLERRHFSDAECAQDALARYAA